jgi:polysaccharide biosynthesis protein PslH
VVTSREAHEGVRAVAGRDLLVADGAAAMAAAVTRVLAGGTPDLGTAACDAVLAGHHWKATLARLDNILEAASRMKAG